MEQKLEDKITEPNSSKKEEVLTVPPIIKIVRRKKEHQLLLSRTIKQDPSSITAVDPEDANRLTALHLAIRNGRQKYVGTLVYENANVNAEDLQKNTPLHYAVMTSYKTTLGIIAILLNHKVDYLIKNDSNKTPIDLIFRRCSLSKAELSEFTDDDSKINLVMTLKLEILKLFVAKINNLIHDYVDFEGRTLLHLALLGTECQREEIITFLLQNGADPSEKDNYGITASDIYQKTYNRSITMHGTKVSLPDTHTDLRTEAVLENVQPESSQTGQNANQQLVPPHAPSPEILSLVRSLILGNIPQNYSPTTFPNFDTNYLATPDKEEKEASDSDESEDESSPLRKKRR